MKSLKSLIGSSIIALSLPFASQSHACISIDDYGYASSPFRIINGLGNEGLKPVPAFDETIDFWASYTKGKVKRDDISKFFNNATLDSLSARRYAFTDYLKRNRDEKALQYIARCLEFSDALEDYQGHLWDYNKPSTDGFKTILAKVNAAPAAAPFADRYNFLRIRLYGAMKDNDALIALWNSHGKNMPKSVLRDRMEGYVGGALYRQGNYVEALDYFSRLGDETSIGWCIDKLVGAESLENLYRHSPNSLAISYILEDYINYLIASTNAGRKNQKIGGDDSDYTFYSSDIRELINRKVYDTYAETESMAKLCEKVLQEGKSDNPMMWATALGVIQGVRGNAEAAMATLRKAKSMNGTPKMRENLDNFAVWVLLLNSGKGNEAVDREFAQVFGQVYADAYKKAYAVVHDYTPSKDEERFYYTDNRKPVNRFLNNFFAEEAVAHFLALHQPQRALAVLAMLDDLPQVDFSNTFLVRLRYMMDKERPMADALAFLDYATAGDSSNPIDGLMQKYAAKYTDLANDVIGTRLMRQGDFEKALPYLSAVDPKWIRSQAIAPYLRNDYYEPGYYSFSRGNSSFWKPYLSNEKARFCSEMVTAQRDFAALSGDKKARKALKIAAMLHFGSPLGDGWAISEYSWSIMEPENEFTGQMRKWINEALRFDAMPETKCIAYYAALTMPSTKEDYFYQYPIGYSYGTNKYYIDAPTNLQMQGLQYLASYMDRVKDCRFISHCDVLESYVNHKFIPKP